MVPADGGADVPMPQPKITQNANGSITVEVTVPPSTPPGVYLIAIVGTDAAGNARAIIVPVVVRVRARAAGVAAPPAVTAASAVPAVVPDEVRRIVASIAEAGGAAAVEDAVLHDGATLSIDNSQLIVHRAGEHTNDESRPLVAAFAVALAGGGLVLLRRRTPAISKRSR
jgi:hypothetical protein